MSRNPFSKPALASDIADFERGCLKNALEKCTDQWKLEYKIFNIKKKKKREKEYIQTSR